MTKVKIEAEIPAEWEKDITRNFKTFLRQYLDLVGYPVKKLSVRKLKSKEVKG